MQTKDDNCDFVNFCWVDCLGVALDQYMYTWRREVENMSARSFWVSCTFCFVLNYAGGDLPISSILVSRD